MHDPSTKKGESSVEEKSPAASEDGTISNYQYGAKAVPVVTLALDQGDFIFRTPCKWKIKHRCMRSV